MLPPDFCKKVTTPHMAAAARCRLPDAVFLQHTFDITAIPQQDLQLLRRLYRRCREVLIGHDCPDHPVIIISSRIGLLDGLDPYRCRITLALDGIGHPVLLRQNITAIISAPLRHLNLCKASVSQKIRAEIFKFMSLHVLKDIRGLFLSFHKSHQKHDQ